MKTTKRLAVSAVVVALSLGAVSAPADAAPKKYKNCTALNKVYKHGVGRRGAHDHTTGTPVTNFTRNAVVYRINTARDGDKDGIACEKR